MRKIIGGVFLMAIGLEGISLAQETQARSTPSTDQLPQGSGANPAEPSSPSNTAPTTADELERALKRHEDAQQQAAPDPARPRTHRYTDQPVGRILRSLAEQAEINYVEPGIPENELTSIVLTNMTPFQAFEAGWSLFQCHARASFGSVTRLAGPWLLA